MSFIPEFGMLIVVAISYQIWYEIHTSNFAVHNGSRNVQSTVVNRLTRLHGPPLVHGTIVIIMSIKLLHAVSLSEVQI